MIEPLTDGGETGSPDLAVGIPAGRSPDWTARILDGLDKPDGADIEVLVARWTGDQLTDRELEELNGIFPMTEVPSQERHGAAMRNAIVEQADASHILFLDDDMVPGRDLLLNALVLATQEPEAVHQGIPYRVANPESRLARAEGRLYERGYQKYIDESGNVSLLDARLMLAPVETLRETPFDEALVFGTGEGSELARSLLNKGVRLRLARDLDAAHINRDTLYSLAEQKFAHGRGRGYELRQHGPGEDGWLSYVRTYARRHYAEPALRRASGDIDTEEMIYIWGTNTVMWAGVFEHMLRAWLSVPSPENQT